MNRQSHLFLAEGPADKALLAVLGIPGKLIDKQNGNSGIAKTMECQLDNFHKIVIGLTDDDKNKNHPPYFSKFETKSTPDDITFKQKPETNQYLLFLCCPALEAWLLKTAKSVNIDPGKFNLPNDANKLGRITKKETVSKNNDFMDFLREIRRKKAPAFQYLKEIVDGVIANANQVLKNNCHEVTKSQ